ncbi:MAG: SRPBCC family protein [Prolixibacteraceae bacterium]|jgi:uncharacterized membrane protein
MKKTFLLLVVLIYGGVTDGKTMNIEANSKAKVYSVDSIQINADIHKVYSLISNISDWPRWFDGVTEVHLNGKVEEGKDFVWKAQGYKIKSKIHTVQRDCAFGWTGKMWWIKAVHNWHFKSLPNGRTEVVVEESFGGFGSSLMKNSMKKDMRKDLVSLKEESETAF